MLKWDVPLNSPPFLVQMGIGVHGPRPVQRYLLPDLWALHLYTYIGTLIINGHEYDLRPGVASLVPAGTPTEYRLAGVSRHLYVHFRVIPSVAKISLPAVLDLGIQFPFLFEKMEQVAAAIEEPASRRHALLWEVLWTLHGFVRQSEEENASSSERHPAVRTSMRYIESHLGEYLSVAELARSAGVSYGYLARLFQEALGTTVVAYIRDRRVTRARHLLCQSTLPIKAVAAAVGIPDLHQFNKAIHRACGCSPRDLRKHGNDPTTFPPVLA